MPGKGYTPQPKRSNGSARSPVIASESNGIEMVDRRVPPRARFSAEIDEPLLKERTLRDDEGAIIHDDISSLDDSEGSDDVDDDQGEAKDDEFLPRRKSISAPCAVLGRTGARFRDLKNFHATGGFRNVKGMNVGITSLFIIGETAGGGLVALPTVMAHCGIILGTLIIILGAFICGYAGVQLAECWSIMMIRYPKYRYHTHKPYPAIGRRACGRNTGISVSAILNVTQFGTAVVFLLLGSKNIASFILYVAGVHISFCWVIGVVAIAMFPLILLRSPKDFWMVIVVAMMTTTGACALLMYGAYRDSPVCMPANEWPDFDQNRILQTFGTVMFAYGGHGAFPTIQHDMLEPHKFEKAVTGAFTGICLMYLPVSIVGALVYGSSLGEVVIFSIQDPNIQQVINMLITVHVFLALTIVFNPMNQEVELIFDVPDQFTAKRVFVRGCVLVAVVLAAITIPNFGPLLDLVGASTITLMAIVLPPLFSLYLNARLSKFGTKGSHLEPLRFSDLWKHNRGQKFFLNTCLIIIGIFCGGYASWMAIQNMAGMNFQRPCYADLIWTPDAVEITSHADDLGIPLTKKFMCCGAYGNISALGSEYCLDRNTIASSGSHG
ncbi:hypothetical protein PMAYCL1PPCAC_32648 [Pristionchus mayeri]|uniref:Amino acid transporter transmembrane domain-containing protein n=1 Tax=Pristionchus mayeri TaxID=1317129 RepID=A0AAN5DFU9_9BILA|nr:hypothetical protein PMAYCL1PPCAC_32648 [Pristionchus mayeri]